MRGDRDLDDQRDVGGGREAGHVVPRGAADHRDVGLGKAVGPRVDRRMIWTWKPSPNEHYKRSRMTTARDRAGLADS
jgi:hypothetical protein